MWLENINIPNRDAQFKRAFRALRRATVFGQQWALV
jgi:hypothetical protein